MNIDTWAVVVATIAGPILAVQVERFIARRYEKKERKRWVFRTLMHTRATILAPQHIDALNAVPLEFQGVKAVMEKWRIYLDHLGSDTKNLELWVSKRIDLLIEMLVSMSNYLGYEFDVVQMKKEIYSPVHAARLETDQDIIREGLVGIFKGEKTLPLEVRSIAQDEELLKSMRALYSGLGDWLSGKTAPRVKLVDDGATSEGKVGL